MKRLLAGTAVLGLAVAGIGTASAQPALQKVTGGGQIATDNMTGPGQTLAFNARQFAEGDTGNADGQLQYNLHGAPGEKFHGRVTCLVVTPATEDEDAMATLAGIYTNSEGGPGQFKLTITDTDMGESQNQNELVSFDPEADDQDCGEPAGGNSMEFGRGNIVIHEERGSRP